MAIGTRIKKRLGDLGWERRDLLAEVPALTPQALSNLILRDSKRSEWDQAIAKALMVSVNWLVYGDEQSYTPANIVNFPAKEPEHVGRIGELVELANSMSDDAQNELIGMAKLLAIQRPRAKANHAN
jgi:hypothetical protein